MKKLKQNVLEDQGSNTQSLTLGREYSDLPDHLLIDIFFRVPSKAIARLHCVSLRRSYNRRRRRRSLKLKKQRKKKKKKKREEQERKKNKKSRKKTWFCN
ncbi:hypothetical protein YC2023_076793 [Brassica napus]